MQIIHDLQNDIPNIHGLMVGDGPLRSAVQEQVMQLDIQGKITLAGYQRDVRPWLAMSDVLLLTSDTEGMPGVVLEAAAMKVPSISGNVGGVGEFIQNGYNGLLVDWNLSNNNFKSILNFLCDTEGLEKVVNCHLQL